MCKGACAGQCLSVQGTSPGHLACPSTLRLIEAAPGAEGDPGCTLRPLHPKPGLGRPDTGTCGPSRSCESYIERAFRSQGCLPPSRAGVLTRPASAGRKRLAQDAIPRRGLACPCPRWPVPVPGLHFLTGRPDLRGLSQLRSRDYRDGSAGRGEAPGKGRVVAGGALWDSTAARPGSRWQVRAGCGSGGCKPPKTFKTGPREPAALACVTVTEGDDTGDDTLRAQRSSGPL